MNITISQAIDDFIDIVSLSRSKSTATTYRFALQAFKEILKLNKLDPAISDLDNLTEGAVSWFASALKDHSPSTERLYLTAVTLFYEFLVANYSADINLHNLRLRIRQHTRTPVLRLPQFPKENIRNYYI